ncbi:glycosyltransferase family 2 protein [Candidatus Omnitrophota bacterium]
MNTLDKVPKISVCIPTYNGAKYLRECLDSILAQTFRDFEILLVDDGSCDDTFHIAEEYARRDVRFRIEQNEHNLGLVNNWNRCLELAEGEWIKFVFQDDFIKETCLEKFVAKIDVGTSIICCRRDFCFDDDIEEKVRKRYRNLLTLDNLFPEKTKISHTEFYNAALERHHINFIGEPSSVMFRREVFFQSGRFNPQLISLCDYEYWIRIAMNKGLSYIPEALATFRVHSLGTTALDRGRRAYRMNILDPLLILHEFCFNPLYEPLRAFAHNRSPVMDLNGILACETRKACHLAFYGDNKRNDLGGRRLDEWKNLVRYYPNFEMLSKKVYVHSNIFKKFLRIFKRK